MCGSPPPALNSLSVSGSGLLAASQITGAGGVQEVGADPSLRVEIDHPEPVLCAFCGPPGAAIGQPGHDVAFDFIKSLLQLVEVAGIDKEVIFASLESEVADFEDAIQDASARLNNIEIIITRNISDFEKSNLRIMLPSEFIDYINKKGSAK